MGHFAAKQNSTHKPKPARAAAIPPVTTPQNDATRSILDLQRAVGNQAVLQKLSERAPASSSGLGPAASPPPAETLVSRHAFHVSIRRDLSSQRNRLGAAASSRLDASAGEERGGEDYRALFEQLGAAPAGAAPAPGSAPSEQTLAPIHLPDIEVPALAEIAKTDSVAGKFNYTATITRGGDPPAGFGVTRSFSSKLTGVTITPKSGAFDVAATYEHPITYQVRSGTGPDGQVDIGSADDAHITKANYATVSADLTPNMDDLNGRPPRSKFWAEDLTLRHERVHALDDFSNGPDALNTVTTWLNGQSAADVSEVRAILQALPGRFATALLAALSTEDGEKHAYGDGAPSYRARATAVKDKGDKDGYK